MGKKLKKLNFDMNKCNLKNNEEFPEKEEEKESWFEESGDFISTLLKGTATTVGVTAATGAVVGAGITLLGGNVKGAAVMSGLCASLASLISSTVSSINVSEEADYSGKYSDMNNKLCTAYIIANLLGAISGYPITGAKVGTGTHKLTTSIINKMKPQHQIERTVELEPAPVIDEIQVQNI